MQLLKPQLKASTSPNQDATGQFLRIGLLFFQQRPETATAHCDCGNQAIQRTCKVSSSSAIFIVPSNSQCVNGCQFHQRYLSWDAISMTCNPFNLWVVIWWWMFDHCTVLSTNHPVMCMHCTIFGQLQSQSSRLQSALVWADQEETLAFPSVDCQS